MNQYDVVMIIKDMPNEGVSKWSIGAILEVYDDTNFEIEISDRDGFTTFLGALPKDSIELIWDNTTMTYVGRFKILLEILEEVREIINKPNTDMSWTSFSDINEFICEFDSLTEDFKRGIPGSANKIKLLFAPTGTLQEISKSSGWDAKFIDISNRFESLVSLP